MRTRNKPKRTRNPPTKSTRPKRKRRPPVLQLPPETHDLVKATTNIQGFSVCAPAFVIRQHMKYDFMNDLFRITNWEYSNE